MKGIMAVTHPSKCCYQWSRCSSPEC
jgi:hypothetical protein